MAKLKNNPMLGGAVFLMATLFLFSSLSYPLQEEDLEKKYASILGKYEFDMSEMGFGMVIVEFYVENGSIWAQTDVGSEPGEMLPIEGTEFEFTVEDPQEGTYEIKVKAKARITSTVSADSILVSVEGVIPGKK